MPTIDFPSALMDRAAPSSLAWSLQSNTLVHQSPLSGAVRTLSMPGARWRFTATYPSLSPLRNAKTAQQLNYTWSDRSIVEGFLANLGGRAGRFYYTVPEQRGREYLSGMIDGPSVAYANVNGAGQTGSLLTCTAVPLSVVIVGQFFEVNGELKRVTVSQQTTAGGVLTLNFAPPLRSSPPNTAYVQFTGPRGIFMVTDDNVGMEIGSGGFASLTLDAIEAFP
jgi:hypothetical protein